MASDKGKAPDTDTVFAMASGLGRAGVAIMRVSGPAAGLVVDRLTVKPRPTPRMAVPRWFQSIDGDPLDRGLLLWFPAPCSFTGEDVAELHLHGSPAVVTAISEALIDLDGVRPAEPGEFTRRAFHNGRIDLTEAEGLADLIDAETSTQRKQALRQFGGVLSKLYDGWRTDLIRLTAKVEALIDFPDEDLPPYTASTLDRSLADLEAAIAHHLDDGGRGERLRQGLHVVIVGAPNAGKSSLLNRLAGRDAAIVATEAGTTRDVVEVHMDLNGWPVLLADTAGLRVAAAAAEIEGMRRTRDRALSADLIVALFDVTGTVGGDGPIQGLLAESDNAVDVLAVLNKIDLLDTKPPDAVGGRPALAVSARTGDGIDALVAAITSSAAAQLGGSDGPLLSRARHRAALVECLKALRRARITSLPELVGEDLRLAARALGRITGRVDVEDILDSLFSSFCIGK